MLKRAIMALAVACTFAGPALAQTTIQVGYGLPRNSHLGDFVAAFKAEAEALSGGKLIINPVENYLGGNERAMIEGVQLGTMNGALMSTGTMQNFVPVTGVLDLPYIFRDSAHARAVQDGEIGQSVLAEYEKFNLVGVAFGEAGFRGITTSKRAIRTPADMSGLKIRTRQSEVDLRAFRELGALPTPMAFSELYTALQTGTLDGQENSIAIMLPARLYEVQKYFSATNHSLTNIVMVLSTDVWGKLSDEEKGWVKQAARKGVEAERARVDPDDAAGLKLMADNGVEIVGDVDLDAFRAKIEPAYRDFEATYGKDLIDRIKAVK